MIQRLVYRPVGRPGEDYPGWLRDLKGKCGSYVIRTERLFGGSQVVYVGESHSGRLYQTLTRHFQSWHRRKSWFAFQFSRHDPGLTYDRARCEVAVRVMRTRDEALEEQSRLIRRLRPRDNILEVVVDDEPIPF